MEKYNLNWLIKKEEDNLFIYTSKIYLNSFTKSPIVIQVHYTRMTIPVLNYISFINIFSTNEYQHSEINISALDFPYFGLDTKIEDEKIKIGEIGDSLCERFCYRKDK